MLIANVRLGAFNGIHLAYLAKINNPKTRVMIYGQDDRMLAGEVQSAGAFYERSDCVRYALAAFLQASLPDRDRRDVTFTDRRQIFRGGRRTTDLQNLRGQRRCLKRQFRGTYKLRSKRPSSHVRGDAVEL